MVEITRIGGVNLSSSTNLIIFITPPPSSGLSNYCLMRDSLVHMILLVDCKLGEMMLIPTSQTIERHQTEYSSSIIIICVYLSRGNPLDYEKSKMLKQ